ncbi:MAG: glycosyltransferase family 39 protein [Vampirovibrio sp.]|nr:glycosyltransferase family 39 protein [Vampirovibrio sp.]
MQPKTWGYLGVLMILGWILRSWALDFGLPNESRPDELQITLFTIPNMLYPLSQGDFRMDPGHYNYPNLYFGVVTLLYFFYFVWGQLTGIFTGWPNFFAQYQNDPGSFFLLLRYFSVVCGVLTIPAVYLLGKKLGGSRIGFISAGLITLCYLAVRNNHFGQVDSFLTLVVMVSCLLILHYLEKPSLKRLTLMAVSAGLATAVKYPAILLIMPVLLSIVYAKKIDKDPTKQSWIHLLKPASLAILMIAGTFTLASPWVILHLDVFIKDLQYEAQHYFNTTYPGVSPGWAFYPFTALYEGIGGYLLLSVLLGLLATWKTFKQHSLLTRWKHIAMMSFLLIWYLSLCPNLRVMTRYILPVVPLLTIYGAVGLDTFYHRLIELLQGQRSQKLQIGTGLVLALVILYQPVTNMWQMNSLLNKADTRVLARQWILEHVPPNSGVATGPRFGRILLPGNYRQLLTDPGAADPNNPPTILYQESPRVLIANHLASANFLKQLGIRYALVYRFPIPQFSNALWEFEALQQQATIVAHWSARKTNVTQFENTLFDPMDAVFFPLSGFRHFQRPGPDIWIFDLTQPPYSGKK